MLRRPITHLLSFLAALITVAMLAACTITPTSDDVESGIASTMSVTIVTSEAPEADPGTDENELINDWFIAFVDGTNTVVKIFDRPDDQKDAVMKETFTSTVPSGLYTVYAFANFGRAKHQIGTYTLEVGKPVPSGFDAARYSEPVPHINSPVPMTGKKEGVQIKAIESNKLVIEVVRIVGKFNFIFTSDASQDIKVRSVTILPARTQEIPLFPDYSKLEDGSAPDILPDVTLGALKHTWAGGITVPKKPTVPEMKPDTVSARAYVFESTAQGYGLDENGDITNEGHATGHYVLQFDVEDADGQSHQMNALLYQLDHIYRNDLINVPVRFTDWKVDLDIRFYPPIGGYPSVLVTSDGDQFNARFGSSGLFIIKPKLTDLSGKEYGYNEYTCDVSVDSDEGILDYIHSSLDNAAEIQGNIKMGVTGKAIINLSFQVKNDKLAHTFVRKLYIKRY